VVFEETGTVRELSLPDALVTLLREQASREGFLPKTIKVEIAA
jgi:hypothetical protein